MQLTLKLTGKQAKAGLPAYRPETEEYTHTEIDSMSGSNRAIANTLRALADDLDPHYEVSS